MNQKYVAFGNSVLPKMPSCTKDRLYKILEWGFVIGLIVASFWFMTDVWDKFESKRTGYTVYEEIRTEMPTTVVCFEPYGKPSVMEKYGIRLTDLIFFSYSEAVNNMTWKDFKEEMYYVLGKDFTFTFYDYTNGLFNSDEYTIDADGLYDDGLLEVESLQTVWSGLCVRLTYTRYYRGSGGSHYSMYVNFNDSSLEALDVPDIGLYVTSEENAYGIIGKRGL